jgi:hypothetical protein
VRAAFAFSSSYRWVALGKRALSGLIGNFRVRDRG